MIKKLLKIEEKNIIKKHEDFLKKTDNLIYNNKSIMIDFGCLLLIDINLILLAYASGFPNFNFFTCSLVLFFVVINMFSLNGTLSFLNLLNISNKLNKVNDYSNNIKLNKIYKKSDIKNVVKEYDLINDSVDSDLFNFIKENYDTNESTTKYKLIKSYINSLNTLNKITENENDIISFISSIEDKKLKLDAINYFNKVKNELIEKHNEEGNIDVLFENVVKDIKNNSKIKNKNSNFKLNEL